MPLSIIAGSRAHQLRRNPVSWWPMRGSEAASRVEPIAAPEIAPTFRIPKGAKVFTIGSCFARVIEHYLRKTGYDVPMAAYKPADDGDNLGLLNKFSPFSVLNELQWALDPAFAGFDQRRALVEAADGLWTDEQLVSKLALPFDRAMARRLEINRLFRLVKECDVVILTLGLVEAWWDTKNQIYINGSTPKHIQLTDPDRFECHILSFQELHDCTRRAVEIIRDYGHPDIRILLTVSPVPLTATFTGQDVMTANTYSKSALRTVAEHIWREFDIVDYFPSYESVMLSDRQRAFREDMIHVQGEMAVLNVSRMAELYTDSSERFSTAEAATALAN